MEPDSKINFGETAFVYPAPEGYRAYFTRKNGKGALVMYGEMEIRKSEAEAPVADDPRWVPAEGDFIIVDFTPLGESRL